MNLQKLSILFFCLTANTACTKSEEPQFWTFSAPELGGGDCDGPCPTTVVNACLLGEMGEAFALVQMQESEPDSVSSSCTGTPRYSSSIKKTPALVVEALGGDVRDSEELNVIFITRRFSWLDWEAGDFLLLSLRDDNGELFVTSAYHATPTTDSVKADEEANQQLSVDLDFQLPNNVKQLRTAIATVEQDFDSECGREEMTNAEFHLSVREDSNCGFVGADQADEEKDSTPSDLDL